MTSDYAYEVALAMQEAKAMQIVRDAEEYISDEKQKYFLSVMIGVMEK